MSKVSSIGVPEDPWTFFHEIGDDGRMMFDGVNLMGEPSWLRPEWEEKRPLPHEPWVSSWLPDFLGGKSYRYAPSDHPVRDLSNRAWLGDMVAGGEGPPAPYEAVVPDEHMDSYGVKDKHYERGFLKGMPMLSARAGHDMRSAAWSGVPQPDYPRSTPDTGHGPLFSPMTPKQVKSVLNAEALAQQEEEESQRSGYERLLRLLDGRLPPGHPSRQPRLLPLEPRLPTHGGL